MLKKKVATLFFTMIFTLLLLAPILTTKVAALDDTADSLEVSVSTSPTRIREGENTTITIEMRHATPGKVYTFEINASNPAGTFSALNITITANATGSESNSTEYWGAFLGANTNYVGTYFVAVQNVTTNKILATTSFTVGITDKLRYARNETVMIEGLGYTPNENFTVKIENETLVAEYLNITASTSGIVNYTWQIPENATPGVYTVSIANATVKNPPDVQKFYVEIWQVQIWARNLANEPLVNLTIKVYNDTIVPAQFLNLSQPTNETGLSSFMLANGNYTFKAFWKQVEVGNFSSHIKNDTVLDEGKWVQLSNLEITTIEENTKKTIPFIKLTLGYNNTIETTKTDLTGTALIHNLFTNINYTVKAERYGLLLPPFQIEISPHPQPNELPVEFPTHTMFIHVEDSKKKPVEGVRVEAYEWTSGLAQNKTTDSNGNVTFSLTFGRYIVKVSNGTILLYEAAVNLTQDQSPFDISLSNYNIDFTVAVIDYFGQPIPNAMVQIERKTGTKYEVTAPPSFTGPDGHVTFKGILGGDSRISIYIRGQLSGTRYLYLTNSKEVTFNLSRYVAIAGYAVEASQFVTAIATALLIVTFIVALTYKRLLKIFTKSK